MKKASQLGGFSVFLRMLSLYGKTPPNQGKVKKECEEKQRLSHAGHHNLL